MKKITPLLVKLKENRRFNKNLKNKNNIFKWLKDIFSNKDTYIENIPITLETVDVFDTVWVKDDDEIRQGWIYEKTKKRFLIVVDKDEYIFHYNRPFNKTEIKHNNKILYFNKPHGINI